jgi:glycerol uptake facilitator-like aquaporin
MSTPFSVARRLTAEALGTGLLVATVVGSGIMAERLAGGNVAIALLGNTIPTGAILVVLILALGPISGAHFNPAVSLVMGATGALPWREVGAYTLAQVIGGCLGTLVAHGMFDLPLFQLAAKARTGPSQWFAEFVATFGLLLTVLTLVRFRIEAIPFAVGLYITAAYWFTASTSFANPAVTVARALTDTFAGIAPSHAVPFVVAQFYGALAGLTLARWLIMEASLSKHSRGSSTAPQKAVHTDPNARRF